MEDLREYDECEGCVRYRGWVNDQMGELQHLRQAMRDLRAMLENAANDAESRRQAVRIPGGGWYHQGERDAYRKALQILEDVRERENV